jgi:hypothetical protein
MGKHSEGNERLDRAQEQLDNYRGKDPAEFDRLNDAVIEAEKGASTAHRHGWW